MEQVVLVNSQDKTLGVCEKMEAHQKGLLHRAFSVFLFNNNNEWLLQQRADTKYHSASLWSNTCCSHPKPNENNLDAAYRRLKEETGIITSLEYKFNFQYKCDFDNGLVEHELDHIFIGKVNKFPQPNPNEISQMKFIPFDLLDEDINQNPDNYTVWFKLLYKRVWSIIND